MVTIKDEDLPLQRLYHWEKARAHEIYLTQPMGGGVVRDYTWRQAVAEARCLAAHLQSFGWPPGTRVGIVSKNCAWWLMADFAIWMAGHVSVPLYPTLAAGSVRQILEHAQCRALFVGKLDDWETMRPGVPDGVHCIAFPLAPANDYVQWDDVVARGQPLMASPTRAADDLATIIYTSGTTGMPKGVMHRFASFAGAAQAIAGTLRATADERVLSHLPLSHVAERLGVEAMSLQLGFRVFFSESLETFARDLQRARPTVFATVPRLWTKFQQGVLARMPGERTERALRWPLLGGIVRRRILRALGLDACRVALGGAAPMPPDLINWYRRLGLELLEVYGMTENFGCTHGSAPGQGRVGYVGAPWPGVECRLSETGEVLVRAPWNMLGYYREPEKTAEVLSADGWLRTGDLGSIDEAGRLRITGRAKELFKTSKGKYVAPAPIENKLAAHPRIEACCVAGANYGQPFALAVLAADVLPRAGDPAVRAELTHSLSAHLQAVNDTLDPHEQLDFITVVRQAWTVENGLITPTLKVKRNEVERTYQAHFDRWLEEKQPVVWE